MQQAYRLPDGAKVAFLNGLIFGLAGAVINIIITVALLLLVPQLMLLWIIITWVVGLVAFFLAGLFTARRTGKIGAATLAGLWAGIFNGVLPCTVYGIILFIVASNESDIFQSVASQSSSVLTPEVMGSAIRASILMLLTFCILLNIGVAAAIAPLGGLAGRREVQPVLPALPFLPSQAPYAGMPFPPYAGEPVPPQPYPSYPPTSAAEPPYPYGTTPTPAPVAPPEGDSNTDISHAGHAVSSPEHEADRS
jgi:U5 snRNP spliceosome subunit